MPHSDDDDNDNDKVRIGSWLGAQGVDRRCPTCRHAACLVGEAVVLAPLPDAGTSAGFAVVPVVCPRCAHVRLFAPPLSS